MRAVIHGTTKYRSTMACAKALGVCNWVIRDAMLKGTYGNLPLRFADERDPERTVPPAVVVKIQGSPLLGSGYATHRLGVYHGGRH